MSRKSVVKTVVVVETKSVTEEMEGVRHAIETGVVDVQTIAILKRLLAPKATLPSSITITASTKASALASSRTKRIQKSTNRTNSSEPIRDPFPSTELISATKTVVMKSLTALAVEGDSRAKKTDPNQVSTKTKTSTQTVSQGIRNVGTCCKLALESLRQWQDHVEIGSSWVNKAYFGYIGKLINLEMVSSYQCIYLILVRARHKGTDGSQG